MKNVVNAAILRKKSIIEPTQRRKNINDDITIEVAEQEEEQISEWQEYHENILIDWGDKGLCYRWLHSKCCSKYIFLRNLFTIPVIIMSTLTGTANFAIERIPIAYQGYVQVGIGSINIFAGIITTISQFLKINELSEAHRVSAISWDKFYRNIKLELVKAPCDRTDVTYVIKTCKDEYDRLMESSPNIDPSIIKKFNNTFKDNKCLPKKKESLISLNKPEILDTLESTANIVYKSNKKNKIEKNNKEKIIENFVTEYQKQFCRLPSILEIKDNMENKVSNEIIQNYLSSNNWTSLNLIH